MTHPVNGSFKAGYVLHRRLYRDKSFILSIFTAEAGKYNLIARGAAASPRASLLQPFIPLWLDYRSKGHLPTLRGVEQRAPALHLQGIELFSGLYMNELLMRLYPEHEADPQLWQAYENSLHHLQSELQLSLRCFELQLLQSLGYGLELERDQQGQPIQARLYYDYHLQAGFRPSLNGEIQGSTLLRLAHCQSLNAEQKKQAKNLLRRIIDHYLDHRPLKSRELFKSISDQRG